MINIGGANVIPKDGFTIDRNKLEERDSGFVSTFNTRKERYEPYDLAIIDGIDEQFVVQADNVIRLRDGLFEHQVTLVEAISTFDGYYPADRIFSSDPPKTLGEVLEVYQTELSKYHNLQITWDEEADWTETPIRQKEFVGVNFGVIVADLFRTLDAKPRARFISGEWEIYPDFYNERNNLVTPNPVSDLLAQDNIDYATKVKTQIKNGVYESEEQRFFPSEIGTVFPKSASPQKIDSQFQYELDSGIIELTSAVGVNVQFEIDLQAVAAFTWTIPTIDIIDYIVPKPFWDSLASPVEQRSSGKHKKNSMFYEIGSRFIKNLFISGTETINLFFDDDNRVLENAILQAAVDADLTIFDQNGTNRGKIADYDLIGLGSRVSLVGDFESVKMRFRYIPQRSFDVIHHRQYIKNMNEITQIHRQRDSQTEVSRYKNVLKNLSNRMGNDIKQFSQVFPDGNTFELGDYDINDNVIVRVKNTYYNDYVLSEYIMAEGFGNIDGEAALWKEPSPFEIQGKDITTNIIIEEFIEISQTSKPVSTRLNSDGQKSVLATFDKTITPEPPVRAAVMRPIVSTATLVSATGLYLPAFTGGGGNTTSFHFQIDDPVSAGRAFSDTFTDPRFGLDLVYTEAPETERFGELDDFFIFLIPDVGIDDNGFYPLIPSADFNDIQDEALTETNIVDSIDKDKNAKFAVTFQQHFITDDPNIIIGTAIAKYNRLFTDKTIPNIKIYRSDKPYSIFDNKIRSGDLLTTGSVSIDEEERKLSVTAVQLIGQPEFKYVALAYDDEILLAFNDMGVNAQYYINFTDAAEREVLNQLPVPEAFGAQTFPDKLRIALTNLSTEPVTLEMTLGGETKTAEVGGNDGIPFNIPQYSNTFEFTGLDPNTAYQFSYRALPSEGSDLAPSQFGVGTANTDIIPTTPPIAIPKEVIENNGVLNPIYTVTNDNNFPVQFFARVDGFEYQAETLLANETKDVNVPLKAPNENVEAGVAYPVDFRFRTTSFTNNWFSDYSAVQTLFIGQLDAPNYNAAGSSTTASTVSLRWDNPNNVATQIQVELRTVPFTAQGGQTLVETKTQSIPANGSTTVVFSSGINPDQFYGGNAKLLSAGFRLQSETTISSPTIKTLPPTTATPSLSNLTRTENSLTFTLTNNDGATADVYYNLTGSPDVGDATITGLGAGQSAQRTISGLTAGTIYTIYFRAKATNKLISGQGQSTTQTLLQLQPPNFGFASTTTNSISSNWGNPNSESAVMEAILQIGANAVPNQTKTVNIAGNGNENVSFTGLDPNTTYNIRARFLEDDFKVQSVDVNSGTITTQQVQTPAPSISAVVPTTTGVSFTLTNNDNVTTQLAWGLTLPLTNFATVSAGGQTTTGFTNLDPNTPYTIIANAQTSGKTLSETVQQSFQTLPIPMGTQWVFRSATTPDETLNRGFVPNACPTTTSNRDWLTGQVPPSSRPVGYIIAVTSSSEDGGFPTQCTTHHFEAQ